mgnify:CR=1 FL=1
MQAQVQQQVDRPVATVAWALLTLLVRVEVVGSVAYTLQHQHGPSLLVPLETLPAAILRPVASCQKYRALSGTIQLLAASDLEQLLLKSMALMLVSLLLVQESTRLQLVVVWVQGMV